MPRALALCSFSWRGDDGGDSPSGSVLVALRGVVLEAGGFGRQLSGERFSFLDDDCGVLILRRRGRGAEERGRKLGGDVFFGTQAKHSGRPKLTGGLDRLRNHRSKRPGAPAERGRGRGEGGTFVDVDMGAACVDGGVREAAVYLLAGWWRGSAVVRRG